MRHLRFPGRACSVASALEIVGEAWTLMIVREAFFGTRRFSDFESALGIAKNVLSDRLGKLVDAGVLEHRSVVGRGNPGDYGLTAKGHDLFPLIIALMQWGDRWIHQGKAPIRVLDRATGEEIAQTHVVNREGRELSARDATVVAGPGADEETRRRFP
jgi:DNA-binding HxlR family transcriptional regulator